MNRPRAVFASVLLALACGILPLTLVHADDAKNRNRGSVDPKQQAEKLLQSYRSFRERSGEYDRTRKEIDDQIEELEKLVRLRYEMHLTLAELKAQKAAKGTSSASGSVEDDALGRELKAVQTQLASELEQAHGQTDKIASQLQAIQGNHQGQQPQQQQSVSNAPKPAQGVASTSAKPKTTERANGEQAP